MAFLDYILVRNLRCLEILTCTSRLKIEILFYESQKTQSSIDLMKKSLLNCYFHYMVNLAHQEHEQSVQWHHMLNLLLLTLSCDYYLSVTLVCASLHDKFEIFVVTWVLYLDQLATVVCLLGFSNMCKNGENAQGHTYCVWFDDSFAK